MQAPKNDLDDGRIQFEPAEAAKSERTVSQRGRGPKGYRRYDERIRVAVCEALIDDETVDPSDVIVEVQDARVVLTGSVPDAATKAEIERITRGAPGVTDVDNRIGIAGQA